MKTFTKTHRPRWSPWGAIQGERELAPGIWQVYTAGHGGILLSPERKAALPPACRAFAGFNGNATGPDSWYEEDCDAVLPLTIWAEEIGGVDLDTLRQYLNGPVLGDYFPARVRAELLAALDAVTTGA
jgi:hypothetical protein